MNYRPRSSPGQRQAYGESRTIEKQQAAFENTARRGVSVEASSIKHRIEFALICMPRAVSAAIRVDTRKHTQVHRELRRPTCWNEVGKARGKSKSGKMSSCGGAGQMTRSSIDDQT